MDLQIQRYSFTHPSRGVSVSSILTPRLRRFLPTGIWLIALAAFWLLYRNGLPGGFIFDDMPSLQGLRSVTSGSWNEVLSYALQGRAGPSGRPISLFTFALQHSSWPDDPAAFKRVNILIHAVNASLLWWLFARLLHLLNMRGGRWIAPLAAALWLLWPIQVSTVLYVVQRMTLLSATCTFLGLALYVEARAIYLRAEPTPRSAHALFLAALLTGVGLGILCKENAIVFPLLVFAMEATILARLRKPPSLWLVVLCLPIAGLLAYFLLIYQPWQHFGNRSFSLAERVLTEGRVLWMYVQQIVVPSASSMRFLYDNYPASTGWFTPHSTVLAWAAWLAVTSGAWVLRKRWAVAAFGVLFFLCSHVLESTVVPLELVFEHRNYLGSSAIALSLVAGLAALERLRLSARLTLGVFYFGMLATVTSNVTALWGDPLLQKRFWYTQNPDSFRVNIAYATSVFADGYPEEAVHLLDNAIARFPEQGALAIARAEIGCYYPSLRPPSLAIAMTAVAQEGGDVLTTVQFLDRVVNAFSENHCPVYTAEELVSLLRTAQANTAFQPRLRDLVLLEGVVYSAVGDVERARAQLHRALALDQGPKTLVQAASWELSNGNAAEARRHIETLRSLEDSKPIQYLTVVDDVLLLEKRYLTLVPPAGVQQ